MSLLLNMLSRLVINFLPWSKRLLISWLQSPSAVILEPPKIKSDTVSTVSPSISHEVMEPDATIFIFWMLSFEPTFSLSSFTFIKRLFSSCSLSAIRVVSSAYLRLLIFLPAVLILVHRHSYYRFKKKSYGYKQCLNFGKVHRIILISELFIPAWTKVLRLSDILLNKDSGYEMTKTSIGVTVSFSSSTLSVSVC